MGVLRDLLDRVARVVDKNFLRCDEDPRRRLEALDVKDAILAFELHQVQGGEIARRVIEKEVFRAGVCRVLPAGAFAGVPFVDGRIELHPGVTADVGAFRYFAQQATCLFAFTRFPVAHVPRPPFAIFHRGIHELVAHPHAQILILIHD